jgi:hypothetical protein
MTKGKFMMADQILSAGFTTALTHTLYTFTLDSFRITDTRSRHNDTDFVSMSVKVGDAPPITVPAKSMGDVNNGVHKVGLVIPNVQVPANAVVAFSYLIVNSGHNQDEVGQAVQKGASAASTKAAAAAAGLVGTAVGGPAGTLIASVGTEAAGWALGKLVNIIFANFDGTVAAADHAFTAAQLAQKTANGAVFTMVDDNKGSDSPVGCGSNSRYYVTWSLQSHTTVAAAKQV